MYASQQLELTEELSSDSETHSNQTLLPHLLSDNSVANTAECSGTLCSSFTDNSGDINAVNDCDSESSSLAAASCLDNFSHTEPYNDVINIEPDDTLR